MRNTYLKRFMPFTSEKNPHEIYVSFQLELFNDQILEQLPPRIGDGFVLCRYKMNRLEDVQRTTRRLETFKARIDLDKRSWEDPDYPDHIVTLVIHHNPNIDSDSMATTDAPSFMV